MIERSLGAASSYETICSRETLIAAAAALGLRTPRQEAVNSLRAATRVAAAFGYPVVVKREQTCGGFGVAIVQDQAALALAFKKARRKAMMKRAFQTIFGVGTADQNAIVLQEYVAGPMAFRVAACAEGNVLDAISFRAKCINPPVTGSSTVLCPLDRPDMDEMTRALVAALGCSGLVSLDFILSPAGACLIELNPRPVASGHLGALYGHDIYQGLIDNLRGVPGMSSAPLADGPETIALFPRELDRDPLGALLQGTAGAFHDIPWHDPGLIEGYAAWLERRHPTRTAEVRRHLPSYPRSYTSFGRVRAHAKRHASEPAGHAAVAAPPRKAPHLLAGTRPGSRSPRLQVQRRQMA